MLLSQEVLEQIRTSTINGSTLADILEQMALIVERHSLPQAEFFIPYTDGVKEGGFAPYIILGLKPLENHIDGAAEEQAEETTTEP